jgi:hypothetical protein
MAWLWKIPWVRRQRLHFRRPFQILVSPVFVNYIKFVIKTSTVIADPPDFIDRAQGSIPRSSRSGMASFFSCRGFIRQRFPDAPWFHGTTTRQPLPVFSTGSVLASFAVPEQPAAAIAEAPRPPTGRLPRLGKALALR